MATGTAKAVKELVVQTGSFSVSSVSTGNKTGSVSFPTPFETLEALVVKWNEINNGTYFAGDVKVTSKSVTGFNWSANCKKEYNHPTWNVVWYAFGYLE